MGWKKRNFNSEFQKVYPVLFRAAFTLCKRASDVEDVVQETAMAAFKSYGKFRGDAKFLTWIYAILLRVARTTNKRCDNIALEFENRHPSASSFKDELMESEEHRRVLDAIRNLPERQREIVTLHFLQELTYAQIAVALGISVGTVKATIFAAKSNLREKLLKSNTLGRNENALF